MRQISMSRPGRAMDPIWYFAFPAYYATMLGYGITAALFPIRTFSAVNGVDRAALFGGLIALASAGMLAGIFITLTRRWPYLEFLSLALFLLLMVFYIEALYRAVATGEPGSRPGSTFLPLLFSVFPFTRFLVIARSGQIPAVDRFLKRVRLVKR